MSNCVDVIFIANGANAIDYKPISLPSFVQVSENIFSRIVGPDCPQVLITGRYCFLFLLQYFVIEPKNSKFIGESR